MSKERALSMNEKAMTNTAQIIAAFRDMAATKSLDPEDVNDLIADAIHAGLARIYGPNVDAEINIDDVSGRYRMYVLKRVVENVQDRSAEVSLEEARWDDPSYEIGDVMEIPVDFSHFGRNAVLAAKQRIVQRVKEGERQRIRDEYADRVGDLLSGEVQQVERGKLVLVLNQSRDAEAIIPWTEQNPRERFRKASPSRRPQESRRDSKGPGSSSLGPIPLFVAALSSWKCPRSTKVLWTSKKLPVKLAVGQRSLSTAATIPLIRLAPAWASRARAYRAVVSELGGERIDIVPWHPDRGVFALGVGPGTRRPGNIQLREAGHHGDCRRGPAFARDRPQRAERKVGITANWVADRPVRVTSREWMERGPEADVFEEVETDSSYETADFPLSELSLSPGTLSALQTAGYNSFLDIIDLDRSDFLGVPGVSEEAATGLLALIETLTVVESEATPAEAETERADREAEVSK